MIFYHASLPLSIALSKKQKKSRQRRENDTRLRVMPYQAFGLDKKKNEAIAAFFFGGDNWNRTNDPMHVKHVL